MIEAWVYVVEVGGFRFELMSLDQVRECLAYFAQDLLPPTRSADANPHEHYWQRLFERLPAGLLAEPRRAKVRAALERALADFDRT